MRTLAIDWGERRIGVAVSDPDGLVAVPLDTVRVVGESQALNAIGVLCRDTEAQRIVVGLPFNMDGTRGATAERARRFGEKLQTVAGLPVVFWDERLSSAMAERQLAHMPGKKRAAARDRHAARIILEGWLDAQQG